MSKNPVLPLFADFLGASKEYIGIISAASTIPGILISMPAGILSDIYGRRRMLYVALFVFASAPFMYLLVSELWQLAVIRFYHGIATAIFGPVAMAAVAERYSGERAARLGLFSSATMVGRMMAPAIGGFLLTFGSFSSVYIACAAGGLIALILGTFLEDTPSHAPQTVQKDYRAVLANKHIMMTTTVEACQYFTFGGLETFLPLFALSVGVAPSYIGIIFTFQLIVTLLTKPVMGKLSDSVGRIPSISLGILLGAISLLLLPYGHHWLVLGAITSVYGLGLATVTASTSALVSDLSQGAYGSALGILSMIMDVGQASGPIITGILIAVLSYRAAFTSLACLLIGIGLFFIIVLGRKGQTQER
ncbi:MAG: MFS transporter [Theionarchaea archaeon]|nr:MFS transporter [Theionarchaea archaeon]MBU6999225.1 MFS transporter [Theionarchaea archaeon]MBU7019650.1 MFS transporter [Theionarchaea archaeon]MBU7034571.1 MFS transporter [Theionarchaea archaeon]MBU7040971.1 MFS transporter [Theionarchaea archaeon]